MCYRLDLFFLIYNFCREWTYDFTEIVAIEARSSFVIAFDGEAFKEYFHFSADLAVDLHQALNATGE